MFNYLYSVVLSVKRDWSVEIKPKFCFNQENKININHQAQLTSTIKVSAYLFKLYQTCETNKKKKEKLIIY